MTNIHSQHRERLRRRYINEGLENFEPYELLEMILFYANSRQDVRPIAERLLAKFGTLSKVFDAPREELMKIEGIGEKSAALLTLIPKYITQYTIDKTITRPLMRTPQDVGQLLPGFV